MRMAKHMFGGDAEWILKYKVGATISNIGTQVIGVADSAGEVAPTTTSPADVLGLSKDTATYSATQGDTEGIVTASVRPDLITKARMSGSSTTGASLIALNNTVASSGGVLISSTSINAAENLGGTMYCYKGANVGLSRIIVSQTNSVSAVPTVPFPRGIAIGDLFIYVPYSRGGDGTDTEDAGGALQTTGTDFLEADASVVSGSGGTVAIVELEFHGSDPLTQSSVYFMSQDHAFSNATI